MSERESKDPMHGVTLERLLKDLVSFYGWPQMGQYVDINCFKSNPSISSSLKFLRRTPWARAKVEQLYRHYLLEKDDAPVS